MANISFCKLIPGGNSTILLTQPSFPPEKLPHIAEKLMHPMHLQAEQVGSLFTSNSLPHLQMMGSEFCVNATRAAALVLDRQGKLIPFLSGCRQGTLTVSGMVPPVDVLTAENESILRTAMRQKIDATIAGSSTAHCTGTREHRTDASPHASGSATLFSPAVHASQLFCAARSPCGAGCTKINLLDSGVYLVHLPGISHLLVDAQQHPMPEDWRKGAARWRTKAGLDTAPASGVVWYTHTPETCHIWPAVEVRATRSEHMETACGSASLAMAIVLHKAKLEQYMAESTFPSLPRNNPKDNVEPLVVIQPSGESLSVLLEFTSAQNPVLMGVNATTAETNAATTAEALPSHAWVFGLVSLAGEGIAYLDVQ